MKAIVQRVKGRCQIETEINSKSEHHEFDGPGLVVLLGWESSDETRVDLDQAEKWLMEKIIGLRIFPDRDAKMNLNLERYVEELKGATETSIESALGGGILWVSQFTLGAELESGFRPSFTRALRSDLAKTRFDNFLTKLPKVRGIRHISGVFGADMNLTFTNWGPVTIPLNK